MLQDLSVSKKHFYKLDGLVGLPKKRCLNSSFFFRFAVPYMADHHIRNAESCPGVSTGSPNNAWHPKWPNRDVNPRDPRTLAFLRLKGTIAVMLTPRSVAITPWTNVAPSITPSADMTAIAMRSIRQQTWGLRIHSEFLIKPRETNVWQFLSHLEMKESTTLKKLQATNHGAFTLHNIFLSFQKPSIVKVKVNRPFFA